jgi:hypothetical protein
MADGIYYNDIRLPFQTADYTGVALTTTMKTLWAVGATSPTILPANYWTVGKTVKLEAFFSWASGTAGNVNFGMCYGAADAPAANVSHTARAAVASVTGSAYAVGFATCRSTGTAGTLSMWGTIIYDSTVMLAATGQAASFPAGGVTVVSTIDTTVGTNALSFQASRSAGADTVTAKSVLFTALN